MTWIDLSPHVNNELDYMTFCNGRWLITDDDHILHSTDLLNWTPVDVSAQIAGVSGIQGAGCFNNRVIINTTGSATDFAYSDDGDTWVASTGGGGNMAGGDFTTYRGDIWAPGNNGTLIRSTDAGASFSSITLTGNINDDYRSVAAEGDRIMLLIAEPETSMFSTDQFATTTGFSITLSQPIGWSELLDGRLSFKYAGYSSAYTDDLVNYTQAMSDSAQSRRFRRWSFGGL